MRFRKTLTSLILATGLVFVLSAWAQHKPFTQEQVSNMVRDGFGDESGAKLIEQRGIDFAPSEDFLQTLKAAGASEAFLNAVRAAKPREPVSAKKPLHQVQVFALLAGQVSSHRLAMLVKERGLDFEPQQDYLDEVRLGGGDQELINALKSAKVTKPATVNPAAQARQVEVRQHVARGAEFSEKFQFEQAEQEYRAALMLDPQNEDLLVSLGCALLNQHNQQKNDDADLVAREALRLNPNDARAHFVLAGALDDKGDWDGAIPEYREALRLDPDRRGDHWVLGRALFHKGNWDGAIIEYREFLRWYPKYGPAHADLGHALVGKGEWDGAIAEYREALRLYPKDADAYVGLGIALGGKGDPEGAIVEFREAVRLSPKNDMHHANLGVALEVKGDWRGALEEFRTAYMLDPKNANYKRDYERLLREMNGQ